MAGEEQIKAHVEETGESKYSVKISVSGHDIKGDEPISFGGNNLGPAPYDLLLAALGECTAMTIRWYANQQNFPLEKVEVKLSHQKMSDSSGKKGKIDVFEKQIIIHGNNLTAEQRKKLIEISAKCPVQKTLQSQNLVINTLP